MPPKPRQSILEIAPYKPGRSKAPSGVDARKLSANESALGPSPKAREAYLAAADNLHRYPDGAATALRQAIADVFDVEEGRVVCGHGSDDLIELLCVAYAGADTEVVVTRHGFLIYSIAARTVGARPVVAPERDLKADVEAILDAVSDKTRIVFLANPNNPTGTYLTGAELQDLRERLPDHVLLAIDAAYAEFADKPGYAAGIDLARERDDVVVLRTFSKAYGLASLRLGWAYAPEGVVDVLNRVRGPFNVSGPAQAAGVAAVRDQDHLQEVVAHNSRWRDWMERELRSLGLDVVPSAANFVLLHCPEDEAHSAAAADAYLSGQGLLLRRTDEYQLPHSLRATIGLEAENRAVVEALKAFMAKDG